jgi:PKD repeat protein
MAVVVMAATAQLPAVDANPDTLTNHVMCGYQGWFYCPGDGNPSAVGWRHWSSSSTTIGDSYLRIDMWPDVLEYASGELFTATGVTLDDGSTGKLFSSIKSGVVNRHFSWMEDYGIDGVFLQRFLSELSDSNFFTIRNTMLTNVKNAASTYGRVFAVEYDVSGATESTLYDDITEDWEYLIDTVDITSHARYLYHNNKPVVVIFGPGYTDRPGNYSTWNNIIDYFQNDATYGGNFLIGSVPWGWRTRTGGSRTNSNWDDTYRSFDGLKPWSVGGYSSSSDITNWKNNIWDPDLDECDTYGIEYMPTIWPGFQWDNMNNYTCGTSTISRRDGQHLWDQSYAANSLGIDQIFVAMFDEYDESTAIMKATSNTPDDRCWVDYGTYPNDWYMRLTGEMGKVLRSEISNTSTIPIDAFALDDSEANIDLGTTNSGTDMTLVSVGDGDTTATTVGGKNCRRTNVGSGDYYMYFTVADTFMYQGQCPKMYVKIDYYDSGTGDISLQYDSRVSSTTASKYKSGGSVSRGNTNTWKSHTFSITEAYFGNRQNGSVDFRLFVGTSNNAYIDIVRVTDRRPVAKISANPTSGSAPLTVSFGSSGSYDPDGSISSRAWDFDNNGTTDSTASSTSHTYSTAGEYTCKLTVTDNGGLEDSTTVAISVSGSTGAVALVNLGGTDKTDDLNRPSTEPSDGDTTSVNLQGGRGCRKNVNNANDYYMYFQVDDNFAYQGDLSDCWIAFDYYDTGTATFSLQYDSSSGAYTSAGNVTLTNTNTWKRKKYHVTNAYFGNRQNNSCDFRIFGSTNNTFYIDCVQVAEDEPAGDPQDAGTVSVDMGTSDVEDGAANVQNSDGDTTAVTYGGRNCRKNVNSGNDYYFYFTVDDTDFGYQGNKYDVYIKVEYYDTGGGSLTLNYDSDDGTSTPDKYKSGGSATVGSTGTWKSHTFHITDAYFGNRQNASADFRIFLGTGVTRYLDKVTVSTSSP